MNDAPKREELAALLAQLGEALAKVEVSDAQLRKTLDDLSTRALSLAEEFPQEAGEEPAHLHKGLVGALERFEGTHPELASLIGRVADLLSGLGI